MIVIAIVGILASIALPAYTDYTARARITEGLTKMAEAKSTVAEYYAINNRFPADPREFGVILEVDLESKNVYMMDIDWSGTDGEPVYIIAGVKGSIWGANGTHAFSIEGTPRTDGSITWTCVRANPHGGWPLVPARYLPSNCREEV
jgi:type IV pilus assembly protein PilA